MALVKCDECGKDVSDRAAACPNCGAPVSTQRNVAPTTAASTSPSLVQPTLRFTEQVQSNKTGEEIRAIVGERFKTFVKDLDVNQLTSKHMRVSVTNIGAGAWLVEVNCNTLRTKVPGIFTFLYCLTVLLLWIFASGWVALLVALPFFAFNGINMRLPARDNVESCLRNLKNELSTAT